MKASREPIAANTTLKQTSGRLLEENTLKTFTGEVWPLVFYGTTGAFIVNFILNISFAVYFKMVISKDLGY